MKVILDTHAFIWLDSDPARVPAVVMSYLNDPSCTTFLSVASVWEMVIKLQLGKLALRGDVPQVVDEQLKTNPLQLLPIRYEHVLAVGSLPGVHKDPFDRLLAAQAIVEGAVLLTADAVFQQYPVQTAW